MRLDPPGWRIHADESRVQKHIQLREILLEDGGEHRLRDGRFDRESLALGTGRGCGRAFGHRRSHEAANLGGPRASLGKQVLEGRGTTRRIGRGVVVEDRDVRKAPSCKAPVDRRSCWPLGPAASARTGTTKRVISARTNGCRCGRRRRESRMAMPSLGWMRSLHGQPGGNKGAFSGWTGVSASLRSASPLQHFAIARSTRNCRAGSVLRTLPATRFSARPKLRRHTLPTSGTLAAHQACGRKRAHGRAVLRWTERDGSCLLSPLRLSRNWRRAPTGSKSRVWGRPASRPPSRPRTSTTASGCSIPRRSRTCSDTSGRARRCRPSRSRGPGSASSSIPATCAAASSPAAGSVRDSTT